MRRKKTTMCMYRYIRIVATVCVCPNDSLLMKSGVQKEQVTFADGSIIMW